MRRRARATTNYVSPYGDEDNWRRCQLAEFLKEKLTRQQEKTSQNLEINLSNQVTLFDDLLFKILILLPAQLLFRFQFVCKKWFEIINNPIFIRCHAQQSETVLICRKLTLLEDNSKSYFHFMDLDGGGNIFMESSSVKLFNILASCDGLILARFGLQKELMIMNPVTRKHIVLLEETKSNIICQTFGIAYSNEAKTYKVVHLFFDKFGRSGCEIFCICTRKWEAIEVPPFVLLGNRLWKTPVTVGESLYWMKRPCSNYLSMNLHDEKFVCKDFPAVKTAYWDKLLEMEGRLGFVNHAETDLLQVWILMNEGGSRETWVKRYSLSLGVDVTYYMPIDSTRNGKDIVIEGPDHKMYVYSFDRGEMRLVHSRSDNEAWGGWVQHHNIPHRFTLVL